MRGTEQVSGVARTAWKRGAAILPLILPLLLLALWWASSARGWLPSSVLPSPSLVLATLGRLAADGDLWFHLWVSVMRVAQGLALGVAIGLALGLAMGLSSRVHDYLFPTFQLLVYIPILAWLPLLMVLLGLGEALKIVLITKAALVPVTLHSYNAVRDVPARYYEIARVNRFTPLQTLALIVLPASFASIWAGIRYAHSRAWTALVIVELLASSEGLGYLMVEGQQLLQLDLQLAAIFVLALTGFAADRALGLPERWLRHWRRAGFHEVRA